MIGKHVRHMRREGKIPAIIYGPDNDPLPITLDGRELRHVLTQAGGTQLISINVGSEKIPSLAREVQRDPLGGAMLHVDFYRVAMDRLIRADVPIVLVNESPAVASGLAVLNHLLNTVELETLPANIPPQIVVDISLLKEVGAQLLVKDLVLPEGVTVRTDPDEPVVKLDYPEMVEEEEEAEEEVLFGEGPSEPEVLSERKHEEEEE